MATSSTIPPSTASLQHPGVLGDVSADLLWAGTVLRGSGEVYDIYRWRLILTFSLETVTAGSTTSSDPVCLVDSSRLSALHDGN